MRHRLIDASRTRECASRRRTSYSVEKVAIKTLDTVEFVTRHPSHTTSVVYWSTGLACPRVCAGPVLDSVRPHATVEIVCDRTQATDASKAATVAAVAADSKLRLLRLIVPSELTVAVH